jgi:hypothetical protein
MTPPSRKALLGLLAALVLTAVMAGCASNDNPGTSTTTETGTGQLGEAAAGQNDATAPTPIPTPPVDEVPVTPAPTATTGGPVVILTLNPTLLLPWPSSPDCISYDPTVASIKYTAAQTLWQVMSGSNALLAFKQSTDAQQGLALVKAYKKICFIGRNNPRPDRSRYIMTYWMDPVQSSPAITNPDCLPHQASQLVATNAGSLGWRVEAGSESLALFDTKADADNAILVMKHYNRHCYIGRSYTGADRLNYITDWFATV